MHSFGFKVVPISSKNTNGVPIAVAGSVMVDIQKLLTDIGCSMLRMELRIQNKIPASLVSKFELNIGGTSGNGLSSGPSEGNEDALEYALKTLYNMLDFFGTGAIGSWMEDTFPDDASRRNIARDVIALNGHLGKYKLVYTNGEEEKDFFGIDAEKFSKYTAEDSENEISAALGIITRNPVKKNCWNISNDGNLVPITFNSNINLLDIPTFADSGAVIVIGNVRRDEEGCIVRIDKISGCFTFPEIKFHRVVSSGGDRILVKPIVANPSYDQEEGTWTLKYEPAGVNVSKYSWDDCVEAFHDYVAFLFNTYVDVPDKFTGEEKEVRDSLMSLLTA